MNVGSRHDPQSNQNECLFIVLIHVLIFVFLRRECQQQVRWWQLRKSLKDIVLIQNFASLHAPVRQLQVMIMSVGGGNLSSRTLNSWGQKFIGTMHGNIFLLNVKTYLSCASLKVFQISRSMAFKFAVSCLQDIETSTSPTLFLNSKIRLFVLFLSIISTLSWCNVGSILFVCSGNSWHDWFFGGAESGACALLCFECYFEIQFLKAKYFMHLK